MKVSELIKLLEELKEEYGDLDVEHYDDVFAWQEIEDVSYIDYSYRGLKQFIGIS